MGAAMDEEIIHIVRVIARELYLRSLTNDQILEVAERFDIRKLKEGDVILTPKEVIRKFYVVYKGRIQIDYTLRGGKVQTKVLNPGDYFGDEYLLTGSAPPAQISALEECTLLSLEKEQFEILMDEYPDIRMILLNTLDSRRLSRSGRFSWIQSDEMVYLIIRKHWFFLIRSLIFPIILIVISIPIITIGLTGSKITLIIGLLVAGFGGFLFIWNWFDWGNDYYVVTTQRVVWIEKILLLYDSRDEASLNNVLAVNVYTSFLGKLLGYGDVAARTFTGQIPMKHANKPYLLNEYIEGLRQRSDVIVREVEEQQMQEAIAKAMQKGLAPTPENILANIPRPKITQQEKKKETKKSGGFRQWWNTFLKIRYEQDGVITYRKAFPILVWRIWLPFFLFLLCMAGLIFLISRGSFSTLWPGYLLLAIILFGLMFWLWYVYTDWHNDIYQLTTTQIFDIERRPLGAELKKSADLQNILTITHQRSFLGVLLNYGDVVITVGQTQFVFFTVYNPDRVHQDIANYQEGLRIRKRKVEEARERERMVNWLVAYNNESKKLEE